MRHDHGAEARCSRAQGSPRVQRWRQASMESSSTRECDADDLRQFFACLSLQHLQMERGRARYTRSDPLHLSIPARLRDSIAPCRNADNKAEPCNRATTALARKA